MAAYYYAYVNDYGWITADGAIESGLSSDDPAVVSHQTLARELGVSGWKIAMRKGWIRWTLEGETLFVQYSMSDIQLAYRRVSNLVRSTGAKTIVYEDAALPCRAKNKTLENLDRLFEIVLD